MAPRATRSLTGRGDLVAGWEFVDLVGQRLGAVFLVEASNDLLACPDAEFKAAAVGVYPKAWVLGGLAVVLVLGPDKTGHVRRGERAVYVTGGA